MVMTSRLQQNTVGASRHKSLPSFGFFEVLFICFRSMLRNPAQAITLLLLFQTMLFDQAEAKGVVDWSEMPDELDMNHIDGLNMQALAFEPEDLTHSTQFHNITDLQVEDLTESYRRYLTEGVVMQRVVWGCHVRLIHFPLH